MAKELLFSVTASDCDWETMRGTGPGGQKRNKTDSKVRCIHRASGAVGESDETRSQQQNRKLAFLKMAQTETFKKWHKIETSKRTGLLTQVEESVTKMMNERNLRVEGKDENGRWVELSDLESDRLR